MLVQVALPALIVPLKKMKKEANIWQYWGPVFTWVHVCIQSLAHTRCKALMVEYRRVLLEVPEEKLMTLCSTGAGVWYCLLLPVQPPWLMQLLLVPEPVCERLCPVLKLLVQSLRHCNFLLLVLLCPCRTFAFPACSASTPGRCSCHFYWNNYLYNLCTQKQRSWGINYCRAFIVRSLRKVGIVLFFLAFHYTGHLLNHMCQHASPWIIFLVFLDISAWNTVWKLWMGISAGKLWWYESCLCCVPMSSQWYLYMCVLHPGICVPFTHDRKWREETPTN